MLIKEVDLTANVAWSPASAPLPVHLAAGTAAQQLDASFSTTSSLSIYELNVQEPGMDMALKGSVATEHRFHKVVWGFRGASDQPTDGSRGVIVGGCDGGNMFMYDATRMLQAGCSNGAGDAALIFHSDKHSGPVRALDFNPFQSNLLASGASESEILVWDLSNPATPMTPGARSQPPDDVTCVAWNCQVQHILASTFGTRCVVWDLRKNEPIIKVSSSTTRIRCKVVAWHPDVATQMCLASEDDHTPFIQLWDLRFATSPLKTLDNHQRGILSLAWCRQDPDLLLSCGKDCRILVWNPNSNVVGGEVVCEIPTSNQWSFDVAWCPRNPAILSSSSFDGHISVYSLMGGVQNVKPDAKVTQAFMSAGSPFQQQQQQCQMTDFIPTPVILTKPPKWCRRPVGASFGFGGKLVSFGSEQLQQQAAAQTGTDCVPPCRLVYVSQIVTDPDLVRKAAGLEEVLVSGKFAEFCEKKAETADSNEQQRIWSFLRAHFDANTKTSFLSLLGHNPAEIPRREPEEHPSFPYELTAFANPEAVFDNIATDASAIAATSAADTKLSIPKTNDTAGLVSRMLLVGDLSSAVDECLRSDLLVEAFLLATAGGQELLEKTRKKYFQMRKNDGLAGLISAVVTNDWRRVVNTCSLDDWKEVLAGAMVYSKPDEFGQLCMTLAHRLEAESGDSRIGEAELCYVCSASSAGLVECWSRSATDVSNPHELQNLVEQVTVMKRIAKEAQQPGMPNDSHGSATLSRVLHRYALELASQGQLSTALVHLEPSEEESIAMLQNRLSRALDVQVQPTQPRASFDTNVRPSTRPISLQQRHAPFQVSGGVVGGGVGVQPPQHLPPSIQSYPVRPQRKDGLPFTPVYPISAQSTVQPNSSRNANLYTPPTSNDPAPNPYGMPMQYNPSVPGNFMPPQPAPLVPPMSTNTFAPSSSMVPPYQPNASYGTTPAPLYQPQYHQPPPPTDGHPMNVTYPAPESTPRTGWNDPPPQIVKPVQEKQLQDYERPAPITHPLYRTDPNTDPSYNAEWMPPPQQQQQMSSGANYMHHTQQQLMNPSAASTPPNRQVQPPPPAPIPKTVPAEHQILMDVFEALKERSIEASNSMPMKRKLEDASRKLEILYDKLRDNELSSNTTIGLHQIAQYISQQQGGDYASALQLHTQIVSTGAFAEIGGFMPAIKYLLQAAHQLGIRV